MKLLVLADIDDFQWQEGSGRVEMLKHLGDLPDIVANDGRAIHESPLRTIENVYKELSAPDHPVSIAMEKQKTVPEVRIIEGLDK